MMRLVRHIWNSNMYRTAGILLVILLTTSFLGGIHAQPRSAGMTFSYSGIGISYMHDIDPESFAEIQLRAETVEMFNGKAGHPGVSASFTWNMLLADFISRNGNKIDIYAGPGFIFGSAEDMMRPTGFFFGMKGKIGAECTFSRKIALSLSLAPVIGVHFGRESEMLSMHLFRNGLLYTIMPEIGIRYSF